MKAFRNLAFLAMCALWLSSPQLTQPVAARSNPDCKAWSCHDGFCPLEESTCDALCAAFNDPQSPYYTVECEDYVFSQEGPTSCYDDFPQTCGGLTPGLFTCNCAPDEPDAGRGR